MGPGTLNRGLLRCDPPRRPPPTPAARPQTPAWGRKGFGAVLQQVIPLLLASYFLTFPINAFLTPSPKPAELFPSRVPRTWPPHNCLQPQTAGVSPPIAEPPPRQIFFRGGVGFSNRSVGGRLFSQLRARFAQRPGRARRPPKVPREPPGLARAPPPNRPGGGETAGNGVPKPRAPAEPARPVAAAWPQRRRARPPAPRGRVRLRRRGGGRVGVPGISRPDGAGTFGQNPKGAGEPPPSGLVSPVGPGGVGRPPPLGAWGEPPMLGLRRLVPRALWVARGCGWALPPPPQKK